VTGFTATTRKALPGCATGQPKTQANQRQMAALKAVAMAGPDPAVDKIGRWRVVDLCRWVRERWGRQLLRDRDAYRCGRSTCRIGRSELPPAEQREGPTSPHKAGFAVSCGSVAMPRAGCDVGYQSVWIIGSVCPDATLVSPW
jgi:hypothetical protein